MCRSHLSVTSGEQQRDQLRQQGAPALLVSGLLAECTAFTEQLAAEAPFGCCVWPTRTLSSQERILLEWLI